MQRPRGVGVAEGVASGVKVGVAVAVTIAVGVCVTVGVGVAVAVATAAWCSGLLGDGAAEAEVQISKIARIAAVGRCIQYLLKNLNHAPTFAPSNDCVLLRKELTRMMLR